MNIKKATKFSILAVAIVAVLGIATVSFAAWQGGSGTLTANAITTGQVDVFGFGATDSIALGDKKLMPFDQGTVKSDETTVISVGIPAYTVTGDYTLMLASDNAQGCTFKYTIGDQATATAPANVDSWTALGTAVPFTSTAGDVAADTKYLSIVLVSSNVLDMNKTVTFKLTLEKKAA